MVPFVCFKSIQKQTMPWVDVILKLQKLFCSHCLNITLCKSWLEAVSCQTDITRMAFLAHRQDVWSQGAVKQQAGHLYLRNFFRVNILRINCYYCYVLLTRCVGPKNNVTLSVATLLWTLPLKTSFEEKKTNKSCLYAFLYSRRSYYFCTW